MLHIFIAEQNARAIRKKNTESVDGLDYPVI